MKTTLKINFFLVFCCFFIGTSNFALNAQNQEILDQKSVEGKSLEENNPGEKIEYFRFLAEKLGDRSIMGISEVEEERYAKTSVYAIHSQEGKVVEIKYLKRGELAKNEEGWASQHIVYTADSEIRCFFDELSEPAHCIEFKLNEKGDKTEQHWLNKDLEPMNNELGIAYAAFILDKRGYIKIESFFDVEGEQVPMEPESPLYKIVHDYNKEGFEHSTVYLDKDQNIAISEGGWSIIRMKYREGRESELAYFDGEGKEVMAKDLGYHKVVKTYDPQLNLVQVRYEDLEGKPRNSIKGDEKGKAFAMKTLRYDANGNFIGGLLFDAKSNFLGQL